MRDYCKDPTSLSDKPANSEPRNPRALRRRTTDLSGHLDSLKILKPATKSASSNDDQENTFIELYGEHDSMDDMFKSGKGKKQVHGDGFSVYVDREEVEFEQCLWIRGPRRAKS